MLQGTVDHTGRFVDGSVENVGYDHDAHILRCLSTFDAMDMGVWISGNPMFTIAGVQISSLIIANWAYPILCLLITPFTDNLSQKDTHFNKIHNHTRSVVEIWVKTWWHCLDAKLPVREENINQ